MTKRTTLLGLVRKECCNYDSDKCIGIDLFSNERFRDEGGVCWIVEKKSCDFFAKCVLPLATELKCEYRKLDSCIQVKVTKCLNCGKIIDSNKRKCAACKAKTRRARNKRFRSP